MADKDIDKGNVFLMGVDNNGVVIEPYDGYLDGEQLTDGEKFLTYQVKKNRMFLEYNDALSLKDKKKISSIKEKIKKFFKNSIVDSLFTGITKLNNATAAQYPINMDEPQDLKKKGIAKNSYNANIIQNNLSAVGISVQKITNMVGKDVIGIAATGLKAFSALYYTELINARNRSKPLVFNNNTYNVTLPLEVLGQEIKNVEEFNNMSDEQIRNILLGRTKSDGIQSAILSSATDF